MKKSAATTPSHKPPTDKGTVVRAKREPVRSTTPPKFGESTKHHARPLQSFVMSFLFCDRSACTDLSRARLGHADATLRPAPLRLHDIDRRTPCAQRTAGRCGQGRTPRQVQVEHCWAKCKAGDKARVHRHAHHPAGRGAVAADQC